MSRTACFWDILPAELRRAKAFASASAPRRPERIISLATAKPAPPLGWDGREPVRPFPDLTKL